MKIGCEGLESDSLVLIFRIYNFYRVTWFDGFAGGYGRFLGDKKCSR